MANLSVLRFWISEGLLKHNLNVKGWNSQAHREFPRNLESTNPSREILGREIGRTESWIESIEARPTLLHMCASAFRRDFWSLRPAPCSPPPPPRTRGRPWPGRTYHVFVIHVIHVSTYSYIPAFVVFIVLCLPMAWKDAVQESGPCCRFPNVRLRKSKSRVWTNLN